MKRVTLSSVVDDGTDLSFTAVAKDKKCEVAIAATVHRYTGPLGEAVGEDGSPLGFQEHELHRLTQRRATASKLQNLTARDAHLLAWWIAGMARQGVNPVGVSQVWSLKKV